MSARAIAIARRGRYSGWALRQTAHEVRDRYFHPTGAEFALDERIRRSVRFEVENLRDPNGPTLRRGGFDVIFCRNVLMYLSPASAREVVERFDEALLPGGYLFLGHAETLRGLTQSFHLRHDFDTFYYVRRDGSAPSQPRVGPNPTDDGSWADRISRASQRISALVRRSADRERPLAPTAPRAARLTQAMDLVAQERYEEAREVLRELLDQGPTDVDAQLLLAVVLTNQGLISEAEQVCARVLELDELNAGAHYLLALCRENAGDREGAIESDQVAVYLDPTFAMPRLHLGLLYRRAGRGSAARHELEQARALLPREDASRILMFGGGFRREALVRLCDAELQAVEGAP